MKRLKSKIKKFLLKILKYLGLISALSYGGVFFSRQIKKWEKEVDKVIEKIK